ncbi:adenylate kinase [Desulfurispirillum indicum]|uniref:Adenylate kinase n=1 Tax=Desulfurispirillum indicum (strain ATCC BAA-1389 / DSM 22839 / S5) TaxID=653733 RepID=E6W731_DESIS|nr:adenylate kinase [Desulfurispirillum indicum]ADU65109.1 adenylate kinase [Desulfurispirillum indicum S5]UCZ57012.1 adenylate kinase [Desulfurispirillum indicum]
MRLILLGAPGSGKGTQGPRLADKLAIPVISTGDILRAAVAAGSELGVLAKSFMDKGELVPDDVIIGIVRDRLALDDAANGFILDGFPRTVVQAQALDEMLKNAFSVRIDHVLNLEVSETELVSRLAGRRVCSGCGATYHVVAAPSRVEGICDQCGGHVVQRDDDREETVRKRMQVFQSQTEPLIGYYGGHNLLRTIRATGDVEHIFSAILTAIGK